ncbi:MAG: hypothetical protein ACR2QC_12665 [Gammaproteobacteria bacterium]
MVRLIMIFAGLALAAAGGWAAAIGFARDDGDYLWKVRYEVPYPAAAKKFVAKTVVPALREIPREHRGYLNLEESGLLYPLGGGGGFVAFVGLVLFLNGAFRRWKKKPEEDAGDKVDTRISDSLIPAKAAQPKTDAKTDAISIDEGIIKDGDTDEEKMRDINHLVTIRHSLMEPDVIALVVHTFRPDLEGYLPLFNEAGMEKLAQQVLDSVILRHRRLGKDITPDQFQVQDERIIECEREAFCHRYMPSKEKIDSDAARQSVGKVYDSYTRSEIQKRVAGEADDWMDVSLRNAVEVLGAKTALEKTA